VPGNAHDHFIACARLGELRDQRVAVIVPPPNDVRFLAHLRPIRPQRLNGAGGIIRLPFSGGENIPLWRGSPNRRTAFLINGGKLEVAHYGHSGVRELGQSMRWSGMQCKPVKIHRKCALREFRASQCPGCFYRQIGRDLCLKRSANFWRN